MHIDPLSDAKIIESWNKNAAPWTAAVRTGQIESRQLSTNQAIVDAVLARWPRSVLDIGCGEGWLARVLEGHGIHVTGVDVVPGLIERAQRAGAGSFSVASYEQIAAGELQISVDAVVCNFALLGKESVDGLFGAIPALLNPGGAFVVQTLHPVAACGDLPYLDGWRQGSWAGFAAEFSDPPPWYFRTLGSWVSLFADHGLRLLEVREPLHTKTRQPVSVIFIAQYG
jgi:2-polyprenyl-3-methyl-5-hydroxy-6-metoxy-1,4-benzoquinol methylase